VLRNAVLFAQGFYLMICVATVNEEIFESRFLREFRYIFSQQFAVRRIVGIHPNSCNHPKWVLSVTRFSNVRFVVEIVFFILFSVGCFIIVWMLERPTADLVGLF